MRAKIKQILNVKFPDPKMQKEFESLKNQNGQRDFNATVLFLILMNIMLLLPSSSHRTVREVYIASILIGIMVLLFCFQKYIKKHVQYFGLVALLFFNMSRLVLIALNYETTSKATVFFQGYLFGAAQGVVLSRITNLYHKILILLMTLGLRFGVFAGIVDQTRFNPVTFIRQFVIDAFLIYMFYSNDKTEKDIFLNFFENRDELAKFKELLAKSLPQSIAVVDFNTRKPLFSNKAFLNNFDHKEDENYSLETEIKPTDGVIKTPLKHLRMDPSTLRDLGSYPANLGGHFDVKNNSISLEEAITRLVEQDLLNENAISIVASSDTIEKRKTFEIILKKVKWDRVDAIAIILNDITYQGNLIALKMANANKDKIIATVSHELRTPLHGIIGLLEISQNQVQDPEVKHHLSLCKDNANLLHSLVNSILDLQQLSTGKLILNIGKFNVKKALNDVTQLFNFQCSEKRLELKILIAENVEDYIVSDENRLKQILINLIGNAIKFTFKGGITVEVKQDPEDSRQLDISVSDTGIGIKDKDKSKLFKMYGKLDDGEGVNKNGVGLGLTISSTLAALLNGRNSDQGIELESKYGEGSKFLFKVHKDLENLKKAASELNLDDKKKGVREGLPQFRKNSSVAPQYFNDESARMNEGIDSMVHLEEKLASYSKFPQRETLQGLKRRLTASKDQSQSPLIDEKSIFSSQIKPKNPPALEVQEFSNNIVTSSGIGLAANHSNEKFITHHLTEKESILVVDDNPFNLLVAKNLIKDLGYQVKTATTGIEAIETVKKSFQEGEIIKVIFMDCQMPIMDGFETTRSLKRMMENEEIPTIPILAWTANNGEEEVRRCYECGMSGYLMKPTSQAAILKAISQ